MNIFIIYFILFSNILLVNSTLSGENAESSSRGQQNDEQMPNYNQPNYQPQMDHQFQHLEEDPFDYSQYYDLLRSGNNFDQRASSATAIEFDDWEYEDEDSQAFEEQAEIDGGNGKGKGLPKNAKTERQDRIRFNEILKELRKVSDKCAFPILEEMTKAHHEKEKGKQHVKENDIWKGTFLLSRRAILVMESWMIKLEKEQKFIEMEQLKLNEENISFEELILNAQQNQKILEKNPLPFIENESQNIIESNKRKRNKRMVKTKNEERKKINEYERNRRRGISEFQSVLFSTVPKEYIIQMKNYEKDTNMETVIKYMEFLLNLLQSFKGHIRQLANSTLPGANAGSSCGGKQNVGQISKQNEHQPKMDNQFQHLEEDEDPFSQYYDILKSGSHENEYIHLLQSISLQQNPQTELHSHQVEQFINLHPLPHNLPSAGSSIDFDQIESSSSATEKDSKYGNLLESFDDDQQNVASGKEKSKSSKNAIKEKRRRDNFSQKLIRLQELQTEKCESVLDEMTKFHLDLEGLPKRRYKGNDTSRSTFSLTYYCIRFMENWIIKMEVKLIEMENKRNKGKDAKSISIEELILNAQQNQKIQQKHPLFFTDQQEIKMDSKKGEKTQNKLESNRKGRAKINESIKILFSLFPKGFIIKMMTFSKESILETVIEYIEFLFNLLDPFMGHIWQAKGIGQSEQNMEKIGHELKSRKKQKNGD